MARDFISYRQRGVASRGRGNASLQLFTMLTLQDKTCDDPRLQEPIKLVSTVVAKGL